MVDAPFGREPFKLNAVLGGILFAHSVSSASGTADDRHVFFVLKELIKLVRQTFIIIKLSGPGDDDSELFFDVRL